MRYKRDNSYHTKPSTATSDSDDEDCTTTGWNLDMDELLDGDEDEGDDVHPRYDVSIICV